MEGEKVLLLYDIVVRKNNWEDLLKCGDCYGAMEIIINTGEKSSFSN